MLGKWRSGNGYCGIADLGGIVMLINENGLTGYAVHCAENQIRVLAGNAWNAPGLIGTLSEDEQTLNWSNNTSWTR